MFRFACPKLKQRQRSLYVDPWLMIPLDTTVQCNKYSEGTRF